MQTLSSPLRSDILCMKYAHSMNWMKNIISVTFVKINISYYAICQKGLLRSLYLNIIKLKHLFYSSFFANFIQFFIIRNCKSKGSIAYVRRKDVMKLGQQTPWTNDWSVFELPIEELHCDESQWLKLVLTTMIKRSLVITIMPCLSIKWMNVCQLNWQYKAML